MGKHLVDVSDFEGFAFWSGSKEECGLCVPIVEFPMSFRVFKN